MAYVPPPRAPISEADYLALDLFLVVGGLVLIGWVVFVGAMLAAGLIRRRRP